MRPPPAIQSCGMLETLWHLIHPKRSPASLVNDKLALRGGHLREQAQAMYQGYDSVICSAILNSLVYYTQSSIHSHTPEHDSHANMTMHLIPALAYPPEMQLIFYILR